MESFIYTVSKIFNSGGDVHYVLPHFQREYIWGKEQWSELLRDLFYVYNESLMEKPIEHFLGLVVMVQEKMLHGTIPKYKVVDGQQRLITLSLIFTILREIAQKKKRTHELSQKIERLVTNYLEKESARFKILPSTRHGDCATYMSIINGKPHQVKGSLIFDAYTYLHREVRRRITSQKISIEKLYEVLITCFQVAFVVLEKENPYKIFESLDGKGKLLSQADLVRNYIAMTLPADVQEQVFETYWVNIESLLREQQKAGRVGELTSFLRHYLAMRCQVIYPEERVYARFRDYIERQQHTVQTLIQEISNISCYAGYYAKLLMPDREPEKEVSKALTRLTKIEGALTYPLLLSAYEARQTGDITTNEMLQLVSMIENLLIRRYLCGEGSSVLFKWFATVWNEIQQLRGEFTFSEACRRVIAGVSYPTNQQVKQAIQVVKPYRGRLAQHRIKIAFILTSIEEYLWNHTDVVTQLKGPSTIEHILPQTLTEEWKRELGVNWELIHKNLLHTLGNLTLVTQGRNSQLSNASFLEKKRALLAQGLRLNSYFSDNIPSWNDRAILTRADWLTKQILAIWPSLGEDSL